MTTIKEVSITLCIRDLIVCCLGFPLNERVIYSQAFNQHSLPENVRRRVKKSNKLSVGRGTETRNTDAAEKQTLSPYGKSHRDVMYQADETMRWAFGHKGKCNFHFPCHIDTLCRTCSNPRRKWRGKRHRSNTSSPPSASWCIVWDNSRSTGAAGCQCTKGIPAHTPSMHTMDDVSTKILKILYSMSVDNRPTFTQLYVPFF